MSYNFKYHDLSSKTELQAISSKELCCQGNWHQMMSAKNSHSSINLYEYFSFSVPYPSIYRSPAAQPLNFTKISKFASSGMQPFQTNLGCARSCDYPQLTGLCPFMWLPTANWAVPIHVTTHSYLGFVHSCDYPQLTGLCPFMWLPTANWAVPVHVTTHS